VQKKYCKIPPLNDSCPENCTAALDSSKYNSFGEAAIAELFYLVAFHKNHIYETEIIHQDEANRGPIPRYRRRG
jgi:hypothetical protein